MRITIEDMDLCVAMTLTNLDDVAMPYGLGLHPYLTLSNGTTVKARVDGIWELDEELVGLGRKTLETGPLELRPAEENLDAAYAGWTGEAGVVWPELGASLILTASAADTLVLYSPRGASFVCVEPLSNAPNGFNLSDQPADFYRVLSAGAVVTERWRFAPQLGSEVLPG